MQLDAVDLRGFRSWTCEICGEDRGGLSVPKVLVCLECEAAQESDETGPSPVELLEKAGVPWIYRQGWSRDAWEEKIGQPWPKIVDSLEARCERSSTILIYGGTGTGKTGLATIVLAEMMADGSSGLWVRAQAFIDTMTASFRDRHEDGSDLARAAFDLARSCLRADVLVLDDLFAAERGTPYALERFQEVVAERHDAGLVTIVTTNRTPKELMKMLPSLGSRLLSRLVLNLGGRDRRLDR